VIEGFPWQMLDRAPADGDRDLTSRSARGLLPHYDEDSVGLPTVAFYHTFELRPPIGRHAEAIDDDVADLIVAIACAQAPIDFDGVNRRAAPRPREVQGDAVRSRGQDWPQATAAGDAQRSGRWRARVTLNLQRRRPCGLSGVRPEIDIWRSQHQRTGAARSSARSGRGHHDDPATPAPQIGRQRHGLVQHLPRRCLTRQLSSAPSPPTGTPML